MKLAYQCPGCWSVSLIPIPKEHTDYECECGEKLTLIDLRRKGDFGELIGRFGKVNLSSAEKLV